MLGLVEPVLHELEINTRDSAAPPARSIGTDVRSPLNLVCLPRKLTLTLGGVYKPAAAMMGERIRPERPRCPASPRIQTKNHIG